MFTLLTYFPSASITIPIAFGLIISFDHFSADFPRPDFFQRARTVRDPFPSR